MFIDIPFVVIQVLQPFMKITFKLFFVEQKEIRQSLNYIHFCHSIKKISDIVIKRRFYIQCQNASLVRPCNTNTNGQYYFAREQVT